MANIFKNYLTSNVGTAITAVYTAPALTSGTVIGLTVANTITSNITISITVTDGVTTCYMIKNAPVSIAASLIAVGGEQKVVLEAGNIVSVTSSDTNSVDVIVSVLEIS